MKKLFIGFFAAVIVMAVWAGSAFAAVAVNTYASENTKDSASSYRIATEAYEPTGGNTSVTGPNANQDPRYMVITSGTKNPLNFSIGFSNATLEAAGGGGLGYTLAVWVDTNTNGAINDGELSVIVDDSADAVECLVVGGIFGCDPGNNLGLHQDPGDTGTPQDIPAGSKLVIVDTVLTDPTTGGVDAVEVSFNLEIDSGLSAGDNIVVTVTENDQAGFAGTPTSDTSTVAKIVDQYRACVIGTLFAGVIDTADDRLTLVIGGTGGQDADETVGALIFDDLNNADNACGGTANTAKYLFVVSANAGSVDSVNFTLCGNNQGLAASPSDMTVDGGGTLGTYGDTATGCWVNDGEVNTDPDWTATTDGTTALVVRGWTVSVVSVSVTTANTSYPPITYLSSTSIGSWPLNGAQYTLPYVSNGLKFGVTLIINNGSNTAGDISIDVIASSTGDTISNIDAGSVAAGTTRIISSTDLQALVEAALPNLALSNGSRQYSIVVTVNAPSALITMEALQADPAGNKRVVPTLHDHNDELSW